LSDKGISKGIADMNASDPSGLGGPIPTEENHQPDPMLQPSTAEIGASGITLVALASAIVLGIVLYGLNSGGGAEQAASAPPAAQSTHQPAGGNHSATSPGASGTKENGAKG
jgi:hypothetical protein